jgi:hypothetical protein
MLNRHWLAAYGERIPAKINPDIHGSVLEMLEVSQRFQSQCLGSCARALPK